MNDELRTYILENMDEGTVIDLPRREEIGLDKRCKKINRQIEDEDFDEDADLSVFRCEGTFEKFKELDTVLSPGAKLEDYISDHLKENNSFKMLLFKMIDERGLKDSDVYNKALLSKQTVSKIRTNENYHPKKETVIQFGLALELTIREMEELLASASYALSRNDVSDLIIRFALHKEIYDIMEINEMLDEYHCKLLGV